jgi:transposase-like protein
MTTTRKQYTPKFKTKVALRSEQTLNQLATQFHVHPVQIGHWRKAAMEHLADLFVDGRKRKPRDGEAEKEALFEEIGRLKTELDWLKKKVGLLD